MNGSNLPGLPTFAALMLAAVVTTWLGISGAVITDVNAQGVLNFVQGWQTLIGVAGAALIGWMAVAPVWRQVRIMGAQAASQLQPILVSDLEAIDQDILFLKEVRKIDTGLGSLSAQMEFWEGGDVKLVEVLAQELLAIRTAIDRLENVNWHRFCDRLRLTPVQRTERAQLRRMIARVRKRSTELTLRQRGPTDEPKPQFLARTAPAFLSSMHEFIERARDVMSAALAHHETRLLTERRRLIAKGEEIDRSLELLH